MLDTAYSESNIIAIPLFGLNSDTVGDVNSDFSLAIKPRADGARPVLSDACRRNCGSGFDGRALGRYERR